MTLCYIIVKIVDDFDQGFLYNCVWAIALEWKINKTNLSNLYDVCGLLTYYQGVKSHLIIELFMLSIHVDLQPVQRGSHNTCTLPTTHVQCY